MDSWAENLSEEFKNQIISLDEIEIDGDKSQLSNE